MISSVFALLAAGLSACLTFPGLPAHQRQPPVTRQAPLSRVLQMQELPVFEKLEVPQAAWAKEKVQMQDAAGHAVQNLGRQERLDILAAGSRVCKVYAQGKTGLVAVSALQMSNPSVSLWKKSIHGNRDFVRDVMKELSWCDPPLLKKLADEGWKIVQYEKDLSSRGPFGYTDSSQKTIYLSGDRTRIARCLLHEIAHALFSPEDEKALSQLMQSGKERLLFGGSFLPVETLTDCELSAEAFAVWMKNREWFTKTFSQAALWLSAFEIA